MAILAALTALLLMPNAKTTSELFPSEQGWRAKRAPLMTRWAKEVSPSNAHPEYPRPQMVRREWMNLNGLWTLAIKNPPGSRLGRPDFLTKVLVPFPVESALSGVMMAVDSQRVLEYRRTFQTPAQWRGKRVLLHFGAVDWETTVIVNGKEVGRHRGGYDPFSFDVSSFLVGDGPQELVVRVWDPTDAGTQPRGKQVLKPEGIWYTPTSGIWQTVWLEPVPKLSIASLKIEADMSGYLKVDIDTSAAPDAPRPRSAFIVELLDGKRVLQTNGAIGNGATLKLDKPKLWSPESPNLYRIKVKWAGDEVESYVGFRTIALGKDSKGRTRIFFNGKPTFLIGPLDQGFWPDGLYTAPTDAALKYDLEITKRLGFNFLRKHVKVEPDRFYYWCDKMGILVFQDMPSGDRYIGGRDPDIVRTKESGEQFERELTAMIENFRNHPCIVGWVPFNEGWGQWDTARITDLVKKLDPTRLVDSASGWTDRGTGDLHDIHVYPGPGAPKPEEKRAAFLGEFGGLGLPVEGHTWKKEGWGYRSFATLSSYRDALDALFQNLRLLIEEPGLSGAVYTQTTDVETELNGLLTYDRAVLKPDVARLKRAVRALFLPPPKLIQVVPTSEAAGQIWAYRTQGSGSSNAGFEKPEYDDSDWERGPGGFGVEGTPGAIVRTIWNTPEIWLRRVVDIPAAAPNLHLRIHHDEDVEVYLDGTLLWSGQGYTTGYVVIPIRGELVLPGRRLLAVHCKQTRGGQYVDVGLVSLQEAR